MGKSKRNKSSSSSTKQNGSVKSPPELTSISGSELITERVRLKELELKNSGPSESSPLVGSVVDAENVGLRDSSSPADGSLRLAPFGKVSPNNTIKVLNKCLKSPVNVLPESPCPESSNNSGHSLKTPLNSPAKLNLDLKLKEAVVDSSSHSSWNDDDRDLENVDSEHVDSRTLSSPSVSCTLGDTDSISEKRVLDAMENSVHLSSSQSVNSSANIGKQAKSFNVHLNTETTDVQKNLCVDLSEDNVPKVGNLENCIAGASLPNKIENVDSGNVKNDAISDFWLSKNVPAQIVEMIKKMGSGKYLNLKYLRSNDIPYSEIKIAMNIAAYFSRKATGLDRDAINNLASKVDIEHAVNILEHVGIEVGDAPQNVVNKEGDTGKTSGNRDTHPSLPKHSAWNKRLYPTNRVLDNSRKIERHPTNVIDVEADLNKQESILIGHFVGRFPPRKDFEVIRKGWNVCSRVITHATSWIIIKFDDEESLEKVLKGGPYIISGISLLLKRLPKLFDFKKEDICVLPVWIKLNNLPIELYNKTCIGKIVQNIGEPLFIDELTENPVAYNYARALVEIDVSEPPPEEIILPFSDGSTLLQKVTYEKFQGFCKVCKCLGHLTSQCKASSKGQDTGKKSVEVSGDQAAITEDPSKHFEPMFQLISTHLDQFKEQLVCLAKDMILGQNLAKIDNSALISTHETLHSAPFEHPGQLDSQQVQIQVVQLDSNQVLPAPCVAESAQKTDLTTQKADQQVQLAQEQVADVRLDVETVRTPLKAVDAAQNSSITATGAVENKKDEGKKKRKNKNKNKVGSILGLPANDSGSSLKPSK